MKRCRWIKSARCGTGHTHTHTHTHTNAHAINSWKYVTRCPALLFVDYCYSLSLCRSVCLSIYISSLLSNRRQSTTEKASKDGTDAVRWLFFRRRRRRRRCCCCCCFWFKLRSTLAHHLTCPTMRVPMASL